MEIIRERETLLRYLCISCQISSDLLHRLFEMLPTVHNPEYYLYPKHLYIGQSTRFNAGNGVFASEDIPKYTIFQQIGSLRTVQTNAIFFKSLLNQNVQDTINIQTDESLRGNMFYYMINCGPYQTGMTRDQYYNLSNMQNNINVMLVIHQGFVYLMSIKNIKRGQELFRFYNYDSIVRLISDSLMPKL